MPIPLRPSIVLLLSIILSVPAWADYEAGFDAYEGGDYLTALREWRPLAEQRNAHAQFYLVSLLAKALKVTVAELLQ